MCPDGGVNVRAVLARGRARHAPQQRDNARRRPEGVGAGRQRKRRRDSTERRGAAPGRGVARATFQNGPYPASERMIGRSTTGYTLPFAGREEPECHSTQQPGSSQRAAGYLRCCAPRRLQSGHGSL